MIRVIKEFTKLQFCLSIQISSETDTSCFVPLWICFQIAPWSVMLIWLQDTKMRIGRSGRLPMPYPDLISHHQASAVTPVEDEVPALEDNSHISVSVVMADEVAGLLIPQENDEEEEEAEAENSVVKTEPSEESAPKSTDDSILSTLVLDVNAGKPAANLQVSALFTSIGGGA